MSFLQSSEWQEIQERMGRKTARLGNILVIRHDLPMRLHYLYSPRPESPAGDFFSDASRYARESGAVFLKIDPTGHQTVQTAASIVPTSSLQPRSTIHIDCRGTEDGLLARMHPKTRYNIRLAERHAVSVWAVPAESSADAFSPFRELLADTSRRNNFSLHPDHYYKILLEVKSNDFFNELWFAEHQGMILAAAMVNWHHPSGVATYLHGGSRLDHREVMAPYALHWAIIREAKKRAVAAYDLGGVDEERWPSLNRFKKGFGGLVVEFPLSYDAVFKPGWYRFYRLSASFASAARTPVRRLGFQYGLRHRR